MPDPPDERRAGYPLSDFPELAALQAGWTSIRDEALAALAAVPAHAPGSGARTLPLFPAPGGAPEARASIAQAAARAIPSVIGAALSLLPAGGASRAPPSSSPFVTALLCLQGGRGCHMTIAGRRHDLRDGELLIFDDALPRESENAGPEDRVALLLRLDPGAARRSGGGPGAKAVVRRAVEQLFGAGRLYLASEMLAPDVAPDATRLAAQLRTGFPDLEVTITDLVAEGDQVACAWRASGTHGGAYFHVPATGARVTFTCLSIHTVRDGRIVAQTMILDMLGLLKQLRAALRA